MYGILCAFCENFENDNQKADKNQLPSSES